jgi:predicted HTH domain antitoxin
MNRWRHSPVIWLIVVCGCLPETVSAAEASPATGAEDLPPLPEPLELTDEIATEIRDVVVRFPFVSDVQVAIDSADERGRTVQVTVLVSRAVSFEDASRIIERAIRESRGALEPEAPESGDIGRSVLHYEATVATVDARDNIQGIGRKAADAESIEWSGRRWYGNAAGAWMWVCPAFAGLAVMGGVLGVVAFRRSKEERGGTEVEG